MADKTETGAGFVPEFADEYEGEEDNHQQEVHEVVKHPFEGEAPFGQKEGEKQKAAQVGDEEPIDDVEAGGDGFWFGEKLDGCHGEHKQDVADEEGCVFNEGAVILFVCAPLLGDRDFDVFFLEVQDEAADE